MSSIVKVSVRGLALAEAFAAELRQRGIDHTRRDCPNDDYLFSVPRERKDDTKDAMRSARSRRPTKKAT